ncbi:hypothetical protein DEU56DRAFT_937381 [Suillus clintonianus]|uniref:uncharacterized protein n=1 Tax=Suillus clintonianus TaxID=1904413 RepID=UPI001B860B4E|nr:uncharacterized protein DEU56DRAFT_937381 [Suillus clintonianus]KAG2156316.1 hypothetical protein DEU56DRAFT_937381 [Suillus clintonianus]
MAKIVSKSSPHAYNTRSAGAIRFSQDSRKLAIKSRIPKGKYYRDIIKYSHVLVVAAFSFTVDHRTSSDREFKTIYEFDALTLKTVGAPFKGHTNLVIGLALSFDCALLASAATDDTVKLWAFESRQLLASFDVLRPRCIILSPDSRQLIYTTGAEIHVCDTPPDILGTILPVQRKKSNTSAVKNPPLADSLDLPDFYSSTPPLESDATPRAVHLNPVIESVRPSAPQPLIPSPTTQHRTFLRYLRKLLPSRTNAVPPVWTDQFGNHLDSPPAQVTGEHGSSRLCGYF